MSKVSFSNSPCSRDLDTPIRGSETPAPCACAEKKPFRPTWRLNVGSTRTLKGGFFGGRFAQRHQVKFTFCGPPHEPYHRRGMDGSSDRQCRDIRKKRRTKAGKDEQGSLSGEAPNARRACSGVFVREPNANRAARSFRNRSRKGCEDPFLALKVMKCECVEISRMLLSCERPCRGRQSCVTRRRSEEIELMGLDLLCNFIRLTMPL